MIFTEITDVYSCMCNCILCVFILLAIYTIFYYEDKRDKCLKILFSNIKNITITQHLFIYIYSILYIILYDFLLYSFLLNYICIFRMKLSTIFSQLVVSFVYFIYNYVFDYKKTYCGVDYVTRFFLSNTLNRFILSIFYFHCDSLLPVLFSDICFQIITTNNIMKKYC